MHRSAIGFTPSRCACSGWWPTAWRLRRRQTHEPVTDLVGLRPQRHHAPSIHLRRQGHLTAIGLVRNLPPTAAGLPEAVVPRDLPSGTREGLNDWKRTGYGGPCPPIGRHRYFHKLYALDVVLPDLGKPTAVALENGMQGHILDQVQLVGTYQRN